jgi:methylphosphotriester-DNA--protein-cysteine methyltransferase
MGTQRRVGKPPEGARRQRTEEIITTRRAKENAQAFDDNRKANEYAGTLERERRLEAEGGTVVVGVYGTHEYHRPRCEVLHAADQADRVTFVSVFDSLDAGYRPCPDCEPGP